MSDENDSTSSSSAETEATDAPVETDATDGAAAETDTTDAAERADAATLGSATEDETAPDGERAPESDAPRKDRTDEDGLPLDRDATLDDVRETHGVHGKYALGCTILIVATIVAFWLIRGGLGG